MIVADNVVPLFPGELKGTGFFGHTPAEANELALRYLGGCAEELTEGQRASANWTL
jgi:hypothetical protein